MQVEFHTYRRFPNEPVQNTGMFAQAWFECEELQERPMSQWMGSAILAMSTLDRWEIAAFCGDTLIGGAIVAPDPWDTHVGPCVSVFTQYVLPEYRNKAVSAGLMHEAERIAKYLGSKVLAYTHRRGPWRYETVYRRIHENPES